MPNANPAARKTDTRRPARVHAMPAPKLAQLPENDAAYLAPAEELPAPGAMLDALLDSVSFDLTKSRNYLLDCAATLEGRLLADPLDAVTAARLVAVRDASEKTMTAITALRGAL